MTLVLTVLGGMLFVAGAGYLLLVRFTEGAAAADNDASVIAGILATAGATGAIWGWAHRHRKLAALPASAEQVEQAAATLAGLVYEQWRAEAQACALDHPEPMPVRWRLTTPELMDHPEVIAPDTPTAPYHRCTTCTSRPPGARRSTPRCPRTFRATRSRSLTPVPGRPPRAATFSRSTWRCSAAAIRYATADAAWSCLAADQGRLEAGLLADLVVVARDPFTEGPQALLDAQVLRTVVGGRTVGGSQS